MIRNCSKEKALLNAQAVMASAVMFGHGQVCTLSVNASAVVLTLSFDSGWYNKEYQWDWVNHRVMCGVKMWEVDDDEMKVVELHILWQFDNTTP